ncbi:hypothetical protein GCM10009665_72190 [Kitasatospora nipponensis]|uniref:Membrane protein YkvI n=1 Tax=Kitasatospora nipponensis TaxID=258049 RepID=A0ABN1WZR2_9ACTN
MQKLDDFLGALSGLLAQCGVRVGPDTLRVIVLALAATVALRLSFGLARTVVEAGGSVLSFSRTQIENKFWRQAGKLTTVISFVLLALAYGLYGQDQSRPIGAALLAMVHDRLAKVVPLAILTQVVLLCGLWIAFGLITRVPPRILVKPFLALLGFLGVMAGATADSAGVLLLTRGRPVPSLVLAGATMVVALPFLLLGAQLRAARTGPAPVLNAVVVLIGSVIGFSLAGAVLASVYAGVYRTTSVTGLLAFDTMVSSVLVLVACYRFRAYLGEAEVPEMLPRFIDFTLAVSAAAIAAARLADPKVTLPGVPPWVLTVGPPLAIAAMIFTAHLLRLGRGSGRWWLCLATALATSLLIGPARDLIGHQLAPLVELLPLPPW